MKFAEKIFFETKMTWRRVILLSVICAVVIGLLMVPRFLMATSFRQPGISFEFWILFALYIILNCEKPWEAGLKTFVAFLISQPLIYLVQVPFASSGWALFRYYPYWFYLTLATLPGGAIAWYTKKGNVLSVLILSIANAILAFTIPEFVQDMQKIFPKLTLAVLFMLAEMIFFILLLFREKKKRILAFALAAALLVAGFVYTFGAHAGNKVSYLLEAEGDSPYTLVSADEELEVSFAEESLTVQYIPTTVKRSGKDSFSVVYEDTSGETHEIIFSASDGDLTEEE